MAIDTLGKKIWETNPWEQNAFARIENEHAIFKGIFKKSNYIITFGYWWQSESKSESSILITFYNGEYAYIDKQTGKFYFSGNN